ncbi:MAG: RNA polymerase sigma factor [Candidatus Poribacteria bacterium]
METYKGGYKNFCIRPDSREWNMDNEERVLIQRCQQGDRDAYEQLFLRYKDAVYNVAYGMLSNTEDAQDMTQEVFLRVFEKISQFRFKSSFSTWLYRIAVNICLDERRKRQKRHANAAELTERYKRMRPSVNTPEDELLKKERQSQLQQAFANLKEAHRTILVLREMEGLSYDELAKVLKCSTGRVKSRLHEARMELRQKVQRLAS